jgi:hypothetical protein
MRKFLAALICFAFLLAPSTFAAEKELERTGGPYVPTPKIVVEHMLRMGKVGPEDFVVDLGSGDGVIVLTAAREHKASGFGVDIDPELVAKSNAEAKRLSLAGRASFQVQDVFKADLSKATVITLYLLPSMMVNLREKIFLEARPGTRVVSHDYTFDEWQPDDHIDLEVPEKEYVTGSPTARILLWIVPARVDGRWQVRLDEGTRYDLDLRQAYQALSGKASSPGKSVRLNAGRMRGEEITLTLHEGDARRELRGTVAADGTMSGTVDLGRGKPVRWTAKRLAG